MERSHSWSSAPRWKRGVGQTTGGSNPLLSANSLNRREKMSDIDKDNLDEELMAIWDDEGGFVFYKQEEEKKVEKKEENKNGN